MAREPRKKRRAALGMSLARPPSLSMFRVPVACITVPAPMKRRLLKRPWFQTWRRAPPRPRRTRRQSPRDLPRRASPMPIAMMPMFSTLE